MRQEVGQATDTTPRVGIDVGSTTTKIVVVDEADRVIWRSYRRHHARQGQSVCDMLAELDGCFPGTRMRLAITGSGAKDIAQFLGVPFIQEVVANALAIRKLYPQVRTAIELGGQDAKIVFLHEDPATHEPQVSDMRMNGSCAGGTGAFIDEIARLLEVSVENFDECAARGTTCYDISGRCGVFAKTDIQPLINQGASREDLALSTFHALAKQTIGGLAQGLDIVAPVIFEGGPLTFNRTLVDVFSERLNLREEEAVIPEHPETIVAFGASLAIGELFNDVPTVELADASRRLVHMRQTNVACGKPFFTDDNERRAFEARMRQMDGPPARLPDPLDGPCDAYLGIDSGSTTTKLVLLSRWGRLLYSFYANNEGRPLEVARDALRGAYKAFDEAGVELNIRGLGTTGYGEELVACAFGADAHAVETVAHALATTRSVPDATFLLDIGGQDMKALWLEDGIISNVVVNEACSSGCGSFLESFAAGLGYDVSAIEDAAFSSRAPSELGSRCTVFMNSGIIGAQRSGAQPADIMAGLCRSIVSNVFTKVVRITRPEALGRRVVVQGGTFLNGAVVRAFEEYLGLEVERAPYPGLMGAIGAAYLAQEAMGATPGAQTRFVGREGVRTFAYTREANAECPHCANHCKRTIVTFPSGERHVTGNRCERGGASSETRDAATPSRDLFALRERLLRKAYTVSEPRQQRNEVVGIPMVLEFWDTLPFWTTLLAAIGVAVRVSRPSTRRKFEEGLHSVTSDTICFPAKLVHGHVHELARSGVSSILMPTITTVPSDNAASTSQWMCAVVKGYPLVMRNADDPERNFGVPLDAPLFHWYQTIDRDEQLAGWLKERFGVEEDEARAAIAQADAAQEAFRAALLAAGAKALEEARARGEKAVVLAGRPYHNDDLVNHGVPRMFARRGFFVLPADALPGISEVDLSNSRIDIVNNYHARVLGSAVIAAHTPCLEMAQLVSFGCGHDAYLTDEAARIMAELSNKTPLVLKVDESDATGPLQMRVRSFVETLRRRDAANAPEVMQTELSDPYKVKFTRAERKTYTVLAPNTSHGFCRVMSAIFSRDGIRVVPIDLGRERAIELGKRYVHNDICFPAQINVGEVLAALESGRYDLDRVAVITGKYVGDCRLTHYAALLRKALDDAGYAQVPVLTNDDVDAHNMHPGYRMSPRALLEAGLVLPMLDALEQLLRRMRPYELAQGSADAAFELAMNQLIAGIGKHGVAGARSGFKRAIDTMRGVRCDLSQRRPRVLIVGEYLLNFHPGANRDIERYLEANGLEVIEAHMYDVLQKTYFYRYAQVKEFHVHLPLKDRLLYAAVDRVCRIAHAQCDAIASAHPLYEAPLSLEELVKPSDPLMHHTFDAGEGVLIPAEIIHHAEHGCKAFVILQPFGCLPNHVCGRGMAKRLKELYPDVQILPLDYDPDMSQANIENRLQMLVMSVKTG